MVKSFDWSSIFISAAVRVISELEIDPTFTDAFDAYPVSVVCVSPTVEDLPNENPP